MMKLLQSVNDAEVLEQMLGSVILHEGEFYSSLSYCLDALEEKKLGVLGTCFDTMTNLRQLTNGS